MRLIGRNTSVTRPHLFHAGEKSDMFREFVVAELSSCTWTLGPLYWVLSVGLFT